MKQGYSMFLSLKPDSIARYFKAIEGPETLNLPDFRWRDPRLVAQQRDD